MVVGLCKDARIGEVPSEGLALHRLVGIVAITRAALPCLDGLGAATAATAAVGCREVDRRAHFTAGDCQRASGVSCRSRIGNGHRRAVVCSRCSDARGCHSKACSAHSHGQRLGQVAAAHGDGLAHAAAAVGAHIHCRAIGGSQQCGSGSTSTTPCLTLLVAPDVFHQIRVVNKRVAVMLNAIDSIVTRHFKGAHRVVAMPSEQLVDGPCRQSLVGARAEHYTTRATGEVADAGHIARGKVEINAGKVTLVLVGHLKHCAAVSAESA